MHLKMKSNKTSAKWVIGNKNATSSTLYSLYGSAIFKSLTGLEIVK